MAAALLARYRVPDIDGFRRAFEGFEPTRRAHGASSHTMLRSGPNDVIVMIGFPDGEAAHRFATCPARLAALERAGIEHREDVLTHVLERSTYPLTAEAPAIAFLMMGVGA